MDRERMDLWCERGIWGLVLALLVFGPLATGAVRTLEFLVLQGLTIALIALWLVRLWLGNSRRLLWPPICWAVLAFVGYAIMRYYQAPIEYVARQELIKILVYACVFLAALNHLHRQELTRVVVYVALALGMVISLYAIYQFATDSPYVWHFLKPKQYLKRGSGTYICPNHLAGLLELLLPLGLAYVFLGRLKPVVKVFLGYAALVIFAGIGVSWSHGGWIASGVSLLVFFAILARRRHFRLPAALCLGLLLIGGALFVRHAQANQQRFRQLLIAGHLEDMRFQLWRPALQIWREEIWLGAGPAHFDHRFPQYRPAEVQLRPEWVHNDYLNTLAEWGVVGTLLVAAAFGLLYWGVFKTWKYVEGATNDLTSKRSSKAAFVLGASIGLLAFLLHSVVEFNFHIPANALFAVVLMALLSGHLRFATDRFWVHQGGLLRLGLTIGGLLAILYLSGQGYRQYRQYVHLEQARRRPPHSTQQMAALERAFAAEPQNFKTAYDIGEAFRLQSWQGLPQYRDLAQKALVWFKRAFTLNPYHGLSYLRAGMCLDWLGQLEQSAPYYQRAHQLEPNQYYMLAGQGWHWVQAAWAAEMAGDRENALRHYQTARDWLTRSHQLRPQDIAEPYLRLIERKVKELQDNQSHPVAPQGD